MDNNAHGGAPADGGKKKKDKVRSAWISFAGRIVAQLVGAVATVALGVMVLHRYTARDARPAAAPGGYSQPMAAPLPPSQHAVTIVVIFPERPGARDADAVESSPDLLLSMEDSRGR
jgi:hypothetical protein